MFRVGQKVVCVDAHGARGLVVNKVYEVSYVHYDGCIRVGFDPGAIENHSAYDDARFRPLVERKTDISIFTKMLTPKKRELQRYPG